MEEIPRLNMGETLICVNDTCQAMFREAHYEDFCEDCREDYQVCPGCSCAMPNYDFVDDDGQDFDDCVDCRDGDSE